MLARLMVGGGRAVGGGAVVRAALAAIVVVAVVAIRIYAAGVLLYGQRPGFRAFVTAAFRA